MICGGSDEQQNLIQSWLPVAVSWSEGGRPCEKKYNNKLDCWLFVNPVYLNLPCRPNNSESANMPEQ
jgi:hypothetical protein